MSQQAKVVVIGSVGVGKSSLTTRFIYNEFNQNMPTTLGASYFEKVHDYKPGKSIKFQFWDTAGQQKFKAIAKIYYKDARVAIVMYDITSLETFEGLKAWMDQLSEKGPKDLIVAIVGNKVDMLDHTVSVSQAEQYAKSHNALFKLTSAKEDKGIKELFDAIAGQLEGKEDVRKEKVHGKNLKKTEKGTKSKCC